MVAPLPHPYIELLYQHKEVNAVYQYHVSTARKKLTVSQHVNTHGEGGPIGSRTAHLCNTLIKMHNRIQGWSNFFLCVFVYFAELGASVLWRWTVFWNRFSIFLDNKLGFVYVFSHPSDIRAETWRRARLQLRSVCRPQSPPCWPPAREAEILRRVLMSSDLCRFIPMKTRQNTRVWATLRTDIEKLNSYGQCCEFSSWNFDMEFLEVN